MDLRDIELRTGLVSKPVKRGLPVFVHEPTQQEFVLVPAGAFIMGMSAVELVSALREVDYNPDIEFWRAAHRAQYAAANPIHSVTSQAFLCGRSPLLGRTIDALDAGVAWSTHETAEHTGPTVAAAMTRDGATTVLDRLGWQLISEARWEYVARCGGREPWAGGSKWRTMVDVLVDDPRFDGKAGNAWGVWGLALGEWVADEWHADYTGAPSDGSPWRVGAGLPVTVRGGAVLHAPWQDSSEALSCHAAARHGTGDGRLLFTARPVIELPWLHTTIEGLTAAEPVDFDVAVAELERELRLTEQRAQEQEHARRDRRAQLQRDLPGSVQNGTIRSVGDEGVYIVRLENANGVLRLDSGAPPLRSGDVVTVRIVGSGGVPEVELVSRS